jgi:Domain of unknown function (DUF4173)
MSYSNESAVCPEAFRVSNGRRPSSALRAPSLPKERMFSLRELLCLVALIVLGDGALYPFGGVGQALCLVLAPPALLYARSRPRFSARLWVLLGMASALALRCLYQPSAFVSVMGLVVLAAIAQGMHVRALHVLEYGVALVSSFSKLGHRLRALSNRLGAYGVLLDGSLLISFSIVAAFAIVLCLANPLLETLLLNSFLWLQAHVPSFERIALWCFALCVSLVLLRPSLKTPYTWNESAERLRESSRIEHRVAFNSLVGLNVLFLVQNLLDAPQMLSFRPPEGMTTRAYAHAGAFWLTVALLMLNATIGGLFRAGLAVDPQTRTVRRLAYMVLAQGFVLSACTYERMVLHVYTVGLSNLHIVGFIGATMVAMGMGTLLYKLARAKSFAFLLRRQLEIFAVALVLFALLPTHALSAQFNVARILAGELRPTLHLVAQAQNAESAAVLVPLIHHANPTVRSGVRALLHAEVRVLRREQASIANLGLLSWRYAGPHALGVLSQALRAEPESVNEDAAIRDLSLMANALDAQRLP